MPLVALARPRVANAAAPPGRVFDGELFDKPGRGLDPVLVRGGFARRIVALPVLRRAVFSIANANDRYVAVVELAVLPRRATLLSVPGGVLRADSWGTGFGNNALGSATYHVDRSLADQLAKIWGVPRRDRTRLGAGLVGHFRPKTTPLKVGGPVEIALEIRNTGATWVGVSVGGRQRGARDNRFDFTVEQGGKQLPSLVAPDFGGPMSYRETKPGDSFEVSADLTSWAKLTTPGAYRVRCAYQAELVPGTQSPVWPDHGHETWDLTFSETIDLTVS